MMDCMLMVTDTKTHDALEGNLSFNLSEMGLVLTKYASLYELIEVDMHHGVVHVFCSNKKEEPVSSEL